MGNCNNVDQNGQQNFQQEFDDKNKDDDFQIYQSSTNLASSKKCTLSPSDFIFEKPIGKGGFGKVWQVSLKQDNKKFAMKVMLKARVLAKRSIHSVVNERKILSQLKHSQIVNMRYAFQDHDNLYLVMDLLTGGDLRYHISRNKVFTEEQTKFFVSCVLSAISAAHSKSIIHRDIKPENLVFDSRGYLKVTDFGIARNLQLDNSKETSGTPGYMAPEVMCKQNHGVSVDFYAIGIIAYECMLGRRPYYGKNRKEIRDAILSRQVQITPPEVPSYWSLESVDFINRLIQRKPDRRIGSNGFLEVKNHPWLKDVDWDAIVNQKINPSFIPSLLENFDKGNSQAEWNDENEGNLKQSIELLQRDSVQNLFTNYEYDEQKRIQQQQKKPINFVNCYQSSDTQTSGPCYNTFGFFDQKFSNSSCKYSLFSSKNDINQDQLTTDDRAKK